MKNATVYEKKIRKMLSQMPRSKSTSPPTDSEEILEFIVEAILQADATHKAARQVLGVLKKEFVDFNELRVAPVKDIVDCMGRDFPAAREKAESIVKSLNGIFDNNLRSLSTEYMDKMPKRDLRRHLQEIGLSPYASALVTLGIFGGHAVPVDSSLAISLEMDENIHADSDLADVQGFLERIIPQKDAYSAHEFFREYVEKNAKALTKRHKEDAAKASQAAAVVAAAAAAAEAAKAAKELKAKAEAKVSQTPSVKTRRGRPPKSAGKK